MGIKTWLLVFALAVISSPAWATTFWREVTHDLTTKAYATDSFLYVSLPDLKACKPGTPQSGGEGSGAGRYEPDSCPTWPRAREVQLSL